MTLEDLIEEIVGDISDEFDDEDIEYSKIDAKNYVFEAKVSLKDFYRITDLEQQDEFEKPKEKLRHWLGLFWKQRKTYRDLDKKSTLGQFVLPLNR